MDGELASALAALGLGDRFGEYEVLGERRLALAMLQRVLWDLRVTAPGGVRGYIEERWTVDDSYTFYKRLCWMRANIQEALQVYKSALAWVQLPQVGALTLEFTADLLDMEAEGLRAHMLRLHADMEEGNRKNWDANRDNIALINHVIEDVRLYSLKERAEARRRDRAKSPTHTASQMSWVSLGGRL